MRRERAIAVVALSISGLALLGAIILAAGSWNFIQSAQSASGKVVEIRPGRAAFRDHESSVVYAPTFLFQDKHGIKHRIESKHYANPARHAVGETVRVFYDPEKPDDAMIRNFIQLWMNSLVLGAVSVVSFLVGLVNFVRR
jgi:hypothetical protein